MKFRNSWRSLGARALVLAAALLATGCSPMIRLELRFVAPANVTLDPARFVATGVKTCPPGPFGAAKAGAGIGDAESFRATLDGPHVLVVETRFRGKNCRVQVAGHYDADGSGSVGPGDWVGTSAPVDAQDRGVMGGNLTRGPDVVLSAAPGP